MEQLNARAFFSEEERARIDGAVRSSEEQTAGEIVPVLASRSDPYERGLFVAGLMSAVVATVLVVGISVLPLPWLGADTHELKGWMLLLPVLGLVPLQLAGLALGFRAARHNLGFQRAFVPRELMRRRVGEAARRAFHRFQLTHTRRATGILIYVSLFERMVVVLADRAIDEKHTQATWDGLRDALLTGMREGRAADGFVEAIEECGRILREGFPAGDDDVDELPNHLRLV